MSRYPKITSHLPPRMREKFIAALVEMEAGMAAGEIANARFNEASMQIKRSVEIGWEKGVLRPYLWSRDYAASDDERRAFGAFSGAPAPHLIAPFDRKAAAIGDTEAGRETRAFLDEVRPILELVRDSRKLAVKRKPKVAEPTAREIYSAPAASTTAMAQVNRALEDLLETEKKTLASRMRLRERKLLDRFLEAAEKHNQETSRNLSTYDFSKSRLTGRSDPEVREILQALTEPALRSFGGSIEPREDVEELLDTRAQAAADAVCTLFIERNLKKLASIIETKGNFASLEPIGAEPNPAGMEARLKITFEDDTSFEARTQLIWSHSPLGTPFTRFPITFHNVQDIEGGVTAKVSQKEMNEVFAVARKADIDASPEMEGPA